MGIGRVAVAGLVLAGVAASARAATEYQLDVNALSMAASGGAFPNPSGSQAVWMAFWTGYSGTLSFGYSAINPSTLNGVLVNAVTQVLDPGSVLAGFAGTITTAAGFVTGGNFAVTVFDAFTGSTDAYTADLLATGQIIHVASSGGGGPGIGSFSISGLTVNGQFTNSLSLHTFAGVPVPSFQLLDGSFTQFKINPDKFGHDNNADVDIFAVVPLPASGAMGLAGMVGLASRRRRGL